MKINTKNFPELPLWKKWAKDVHALRILIFIDVNNEGISFYIALLANESKKEIIKRYQMSGNRFIGSISIKSKT